MITVYTKPNCVQCTATKRALSKAGVTYREVDLTVDANALAHLKALGYAQAPVVVAGPDSWSGYRPPPPPPPPPPRPPPGPATPPARPRSP